MNDSTDALYMMANQLGEVASAINNNPHDQGFSLHDEIILRVIGGLCSREDFCNITPSYIADYALDVADAVQRKQKQKIAEQVARVKSKLDSHLG